MIEATGIYKTRLTVDDEGVTIDSKSFMGNTAIGSPLRSVPFGDITAVSFKAASKLVNGQMIIESLSGRMVFNFMYNKGATEPKQAYDEIVAKAPNAGIAARNATAFMEIFNETAGASGPLAKAGKDYGFMFNRDMDIVTYKGVSQPMAGATAVVDSAGELSRRPTLTRVAVGGLVLGLAGAVGGGLLQKKQDSRQLFLLIDGVQAAWAVEVKASKRAEATQFAALFNTAAKNAGASAATAQNAAAEEQAVAAPTTAPRDIAAKLSTLASLHSSGAISDEEYAQAKAAALQGG